MKYTESKNKTGHIYWDTLYFVLLILFHGQNKLQIRQKKFTKIVGKIGAPESLKTKTD